MWWLVGEDEGIRSKKLNNWKLAGIFPPKNWTFPPKLEEFNCLEFYLKSIKY
jgi:hypothetical protein